jgi:pyrrolidone-carboxylate peptidase
MDTRNELSNKEVVLFVTGFGKFGKILENPTTTLVERLPELLTDHPI